MRKEEGEREERVKGRGMGRGREEWGGRRLGVTEEGRRVGKSIRGREHRFRV